MDAALRSAVAALTAGPGGQSFAAALTPAALSNLAATHPTTLTAQLTVALVAACYAGNVTTGYWSCVPRHCRRRAGGRAGRPAGPAGRRARRGVARALPAQRGFNRA